MFFCAVEVFLAFTLLSGLIVLSFNICKRSGRSVHASHRSNVVGLSGVNAGRQGEFSYSVKLVFNGVVDLIDDFVDGVLSVVG